MRNGENLPETQKNEHGGPRDKGMGASKEVRGCPKKVTELDRRDRVGFL